MRKASQSDLFGLDNMAGVWASNFSNEKVLDYKLLRRRPTQSDRDLLVLMTSCKELFIVSGVRRMGTAIRYRGEWSLSALRAVLENFSFGDCWAFAISLSGFDGRGRAVSDADR